MFIIFFRLAWLSDAALGDVQFHFAVLSLRFTRAHSISYVWEPFRKLISNVAGLIVAFLLVSRVFLLKNQIF